MPAPQHILIVDDSATARMFIERCLAVAGLGSATVATAANGVEALAHLRSQPCDLMISDLIMPDMGGMDLMRRIAASPRLNQVRVIIVSSASNPAVEQELRSLGALDVLQKPVSPAAIRAALENLDDDQDHDDAEDSWG